MANPSSIPPQPWKAGEPISAAKLNAMSDGPIRNITVGPGLVSSRSGGNVSISLGRQSFSGVESVPVKVSSTIASQIGRYNGMAILMRPKQDASGNLAESDVGKLPDSDDCVIWHAPEIAIGSAKHLLKTDAIYVGRVAGVTSDAKWIVLIGVLPIGETSSPVTIGTNDEGLESADATTWSRATDGTPVDEWIQTRQGYFHAGDQKWYAYARKHSWDACGLLISIGAETRIEIDAPEDCST